MREDEDTVTEKQEVTEPDAPPAAAPIEVFHRRAPRYGRFITTGVWLGGAAAFAVAVATRGWSALTTSNTFWLLLFVLGVVGALAGAALALVLDRRSIAALDAQAGPAPATPTPVPPDAVAHP